MRLLLFPLAFMANTFAVMALMIGLSLFGQSALAADFGLVHGATVALFYAFSGNARSLILADSAEITAGSILRIRLLMVLPLAVFAWMLSIGVVEGDWLFVLFLVVRRSTEWIAEVFLCEQELHYRPRVSLRFLLTQGGLSLFLLLALLQGWSLAPVMLLIWALSPLLACVSLTLLRSAWSNPFPAFSGLRQLLPHFGSTAVIGVSVYVFRLFILLLVGKQVAGDLYSAFALGGLLGAVFTQALGATMVRHARNRDGLERVFQAFKHLQALVLLGGLMLTLSVWLLPGWLDWTGGGGLFWLAVGASLVGGGVMVQAQQVRLEILQSERGGDVFGSDMLANILLVAAIPFMYYGLGVNALAYLYLLGALLSWLFYISEEKGFLMGGAVRHIESRWLLPALALVLFVPIFFQISNGLYLEQSASFSSGGMFALLPIPISVFACYAGILLLGKYTQVRLSLVVVFLVFIGMLTSSMFVVVGQVEEKGKLILLVQYVLPIFALVLGQQFGVRQSGLSGLAKIILGILLVIVPLQLFSTFASGFGYLSPSVYLFSIYQHLQYVPVILIGGFIFSLFTLWEDASVRYHLLLLAPLMGIYAALSISMLAMFLLLGGLSGFMLRSLLLGPYRWRAMCIAGLGLGGLLLGFFYFVNTGLLADKVGAGDIGPKNLQDRIEYWRYYYTGITESAQSLIFGHLKAPDRAQYPSAHNYYLDFIYNFGLIGLLPILGLIGLTIYRVAYEFDRIWRSPGVLGLAGVVIFLLLIDNSLKVGMRQPYPGIITFYLWGLLLAWLDKLRMQTGNSLVKSDL